MISINNDIDNVKYIINMEQCNDKNIELWLSKGKILLNIHFNDEYKINESLRCDRWSTSGLLVITENSKDDNDLDIKELLIIEKYEKLVDKIIEVLSDYNRYYKEYMEKLLEKIESIRELRNVEMKKVLEKIEYG